VVQAAGFEFARSEHPQAEEQLWQLNFEEASS
jgi:hypothetical protein